MKFLKGNIEMDTKISGYVNALLSALNDKNINHIKSSFDSIINLGDKNIFDEKVSTDKTNIFGEPITKHYGSYSVVDIMNSIINDPQKLDYTNGHIYYAQMILDMIEDFKKTV